MRRLLACVLLAMAAFAQAAESPLIVISLDGFRRDYLERFPNEAATLRRLAREGVSARGLIPVFPSNTFPNHYSIVTGLYPARHGIINNEFLDPESGLVFRSNQAAAVRDARWWGGEPIWVTAIKQGRKAATAFWIGSEAEIHGVRPTYWRPYDYSIPFERRLDEVAGWLKRPANERPAVVVFYLEETNSAGHRFGPASPEVAAAIKLGDERIATLIARLKADGVTPNLMIVSDHGMAATSIDRVVILDDHIDPTSVLIDSDGSVVALRPLKTDAASILRAFEKVPHVKAYRSGELPAHLRFRDNPRIAPVWLLPEEGWEVTTRAGFERTRKRYAAQGFLQGDHGYDPASPTMHGVFIAHGPAFRPATELPAFENVHLYNLMCAVLQLKPAANDGDDRLVTSALRR